MEYYMIGAQVNLVTKSPLVSGPDSLPLYYFTAVEAERRLAWFLLLLVLPRVGIVSSNIMGDEAASTSSPAESQTQPQQSAAVSAANSVLVCFVQVQCLSPVYYFTCFV
jgi:hypothetical protein